MSQKDFNRGMFGASLEDVLAKRKMEQKARSNANLSRWEAEDDMQVTDTEVAGDALGQYLGGMFNSRGGDPEMEAGRAADAKAVAMRQEMDGATTTQEQLTVMMKYAQSPADKVAFAEKIDSLNAPKEGTTTDQKNLIARGILPGTPRHTAELEKIANAKLSANQKGGDFRNTQSDKYYDDANDQGNKAESSLPLLEQLYNEALNPDLGSGVLAEQVNKAKEFALAFGYDSAEFEKEVGAAQTFASVQTILLNKILNEATGPQTDEDAKRARRSLAQFTDQPWAREAKAMLSMQVAKTKMEKRDWMVEYANSDPNMTSKQVETAWRKHDKSRVSRASSDFAYRHPPKNGQKVGSPVFFGDYMDEAMRANPGDYESVDGNPPLMNREKLATYFKEDIAAAKLAKKSKK